MLRIVSNFLGVIGFLETYNGAVTALATVAIGAFTFALVRVTNRQARLTKEAADAAILNAEALISAERAHLFVVVERDNLQEALRAARWYNNSPGMDDGLVGNRPALEFKIRNLGKTPAIMSAISYSLSQAVADETTWSHEVRDTIVNPVIEGGKESTPPTPCEIDSTTFTVGQSRTVLSGANPLFFYGYVTFRDTFNREHTYFWRYRNRGLRYVLEYQEEREGGV